MLSSSLRPSKGKEREILQALFTIAVYQLPCVYFE
ncbi:hypothetical protein E1A91_A11G265300v1 [Gossypium mustelinum]|uniref:Uncharacterized protein n=1 Tax=Gossypium mustelinum TaxID=34275 RepID=A0A5D2XB35_GOSMU|nr:hypothetical protein E1A91_A11G265300v1 [Gossypium mustelinum]